MLNYTQQMIIDFFQSSLYNLQGERKEHLWDYKMISLWQ